jgi:hypothetical protein
MSFAAYTEEPSTPSIDSLIVPSILPLLQPSGAASHSTRISEKILNSNNLEEQLDKVRKSLAEAASNGDPIAQVDLIKAYQNNTYGFKLTRANQKIILKLLSNFAENNSLLQPVLLRAYKDGNFGINYKKKRNATKGKNLALQYIESPAIRDLIIEAMREERLTFNPHYNYLPLLTKLAFEFKNESAQTFLLECYIDGKYGADFLNKKSFRYIVKKLEPYADRSADLATLVVFIWEQNFLGIKNKKKLHREQFRIKNRFGQKSFKEQQRGNFFSRDFINSNA